MVKKVINGSLIVTLRWNYKQQYVIALRNKTLIIEVRNHFSGLSLAQSVQSEWSVYPWWCFIIVCQITVSRFVRSPFVGFVDKSFLGAGSCWHLLRGICSLYQVSSVRKGRNFLLKRTQPKKKTTKTKISISPEFSIRQPKTCLPFTWTEMRWCLCVTQFILFLISPASKGYN